MPLTPVVVQSIKVMVFWNDIEQDIRANQILSVGSIGSLETDISGHSFSSCVRLVQQLGQLPSVVSHERLNLLVLTGVACSRFSM